MRGKFFIIPFLVIMIIFVGQIPDSLGHGLGSEIMPPVMIGDTEATLEVNSFTNYVDVDGKEIGIRQITINLFESFTNNNSNEVALINNVTFQVELIKGDKILVKEKFQRDDGNLIMNLAPSDNEQVRIMERETFASFLGLASEQYNFEGKIFENGGLYEFKIKVLTINNYDNVLTDPANYELGISIEETTRYEINDANYGKQELGIVTFFDQITDFEYNNKTKEIEFSFPFKWNQKTIDQTTVIHEEVLVPKTFGDLLVSKYVATLNGIDLPESMINIDDFAVDDRLIHIIVSQKELQEIFSNNQFSDDLVTIVLKPESNLPLSGVTENGQFKINLWWENEIKSNSNIRLNYDILDTFLKDRPISVPYELKLFHNEKEIQKRTGISASSKMQSNSFEFFIPTDISGILVVKFENLDGSKLANVEFPVIIDRKNPISTSYQIPNWVKNNAGWWADGQIPDSAFVQGIQFLIKEGIIVIPPTEQEASSESTSIPAWIKNNAGWWADGQIPDSAFVQGIQFLIKEGIIVIEQERLETESQVVESLDLTISSPPKFEKYFGKYVDVFGVPIYATSQVTDGKVLHAANVLAQYLDNDADGTPDNPLVVEKLKETNSVIPLFANEWEDETSKIWDDFSDDGYGSELNCWIALYADETNPRNQFDASLEEILHVITQCGYGEAYPEIFAEKEGSALSNAMTNAIESRHYNPFVDERMPFGDQHTEYIYWALTSILGAQENRDWEDIQEWKLNTKEKIMEGDPDIYNLLTEPEYKFPTILPDGNYQG